MKPIPIRRTSVLGVAVALLACDAPSPAGVSNDIPLRVVAIELTSINTYYPEHMPDEALNSPICQVRLNVTVRMPDACTGFYHDLTRPSHVRDGNVFRYDFTGSRQAGYCPGGPVDAALGLCLPGDGAMPPPPALAPGHYVVIANGFTWGFDLP